jgi:hypothetical protein
VYLAGGNLSFYDHVSILWLIQGLFMYLILQMRPLCISLGTLSQVDRAAMTTVVHPLNEILLGAKNVVTSWLMVGYTRHHFLMINNDTLKATNNENNKR